MWSFWLFLLFKGQRSCYYFGQHKSEPESWEKREIIVLGFDIGNSLNSVSSRCLDSVADEMDLAQKKHLRGTREPFYTLVWRCCASFSGLIWGAWTHSSSVQAEGFSMRWPSFSSLKSSSTGTPGYGDPPRVKISHSRTPKDHLQQHGGSFRGSSGTRWTRWWFIESLTAPPPQRHQVIVLLPVSRSFSLFYNWITFQYLERTSWTSDELLNIFMQTKQEKEPTDGVIISLLSCDWINIQTHLFM